MTGSGHYFVEWKEQFVSQERGNRVVHYFLKDSVGESILAVVGTERSVRHMFYVVAEEFVQACGAENSIHAGFKWRSRREVVDWLTSMLSKQHLQSKSPKHDWQHALESSEYSINGLGGQPMQGRIPRNLDGHNSDIVWSGVAWTCGKQLKHYPAFCRNGIMIAIQSFVSVMAKGENHYLAYLEDMYEDKKGLKKVRVRWFHHNQEVKGVIPVRNVHPKEVFITPYSQVISAECVDGPATVLNREHFEECLASFPDAFSNRVHLCFRQFRGNKVNPFDLSKLRGYFNQPILTHLNSEALPRTGSVGYGLPNEEDEEFSHNENVKSGAKRTRNGRGSKTLLTGHSGIGMSGSQITGFEPSYINLRYDMSGKRSLFREHVASQLQYAPLFKVDDKIELLCQDSGIRGCWFQSTVLQVSRKQIKVQYEDLRDEDEYGNLEEWIPAFKLAMPDKLGMRCLGRPTIRPSPTVNEQTGAAFVVGSAVDAWWSDGWWEGVVIGFSSSSDDILQVYFPGESFFLSVQKKDVRTSRDWIGNRWVDIQAKPDILSAISVAISPDTKMSLSSTVAKHTNPDGCTTCCEKAPASCELNNAEEKDETATTVSNESIAEAMDCNNDDDEDNGKPPSTDDKINNDVGNDVNFNSNEVDNARRSDENDAKSNDDKVGVEAFQTSGNCKTVELMEVTA